VYTVRLPKMNIGVGIYVHIVPMVVGCAILALSILLLARAILSRTKPSGETAEMSDQNRVSFYFTLVLFLLYALLIESVGFIIMTLLYLIIQINLLSMGQKRRQLIIVGVSVITTIVIYILFDKVLTLFLPSGVLG
ncbi:tripartite tricarboxylate transporter TctB family protein, partial [Sporosarcina cascadiensis]|uniref:tripartite tricarboxylate transporter TctB family protein n=1 Tax=Sporosarcina cascadiensis TaxID=2660747 RepID=UPI00129A198D